MDVRKRYEAWLNNPFFDEATHQELEAIADDPEEIQDRFYQDLKFGTAGLRGKVGAGTNRMNRYIVARATEAFARTIVEDGEAAKKAGVVIARDIRHQSDVFARVAAEVFAAHGIHVYLFEEIQPTPVLSYAIRHLKTHGGLMITASHNPREYNGYKAYGPEASQILEGLADRILRHIDGIADFSEVQSMPLEEGFAQGLIEWAPQSVIDAYLEKVLALTIYDEDALLDKNINLVYTPLNGCGNKLVREVLKRRGFSNVHIVKEQENPDPDFTTVGYPNPEDPKAFAYAIALGKKVGADLLLATDPDSDRIAIEVRNPDGNYVFINGNRIGALLVNYILSQKKAKGILPKNGAVIKTIVTGDLTRAICREYGVETLDVLTGFKNIAAPINAWDENGAHKFLFGFEESIGFNQGAFVRDKDAVSTAMTIVEMAAFYKKQGKNLLQVLEELYERYGYYNESLVSVVLEGMDGQALIGRIMEDFRAKPIAEIDNMKLVEAVDYQKDETGLPKSNVLKYRYDDKSWYALRPSGTEPKIKLYMYSVADNRAASEEKLEKIEAVCRERMDRVQ
uniref:phospho-sugar mutase n=1 Tax=Ndongobacter massiliensis TaxID=1871025 RepID=UPI0009307785|nr:phospho-sugar mutase [Ndongobacter massiliensis]